MKDIIDKLNKQFESRIRLGIMSVLMVNDWIDFNSLKDLLDATDGNLSSHLNSLEKNELIEVKKEFAGRKPKTSYRATLQGRNAFKEHLEALENLINKSDK